MNKKYLLLLSLVFFASHMYAMEDTGDEDRPEVTCRALVPYKPPILAPLGIDPKDVIKIQECCICYKNFGATENNPHPAMVTFTSHDAHFHLSCLQAWLKQNPSCPLCRKPLNHFVNQATDDQEESSSESDSEDESIRIGERYNTTPLEQANIQIRILQQELRKKGLTFLCFCNGMIFGVIVTLLAIQNPSRNFDHQF